MNTVRLRLGGTRLRAITLIAILAVPLLLAATYSYVREREAARRAAESRALNIAVLAQREYQLRAATAHQLIGSLLGFDASEALMDIKISPQRCNRSLADVLARTPGYLNLFVADLQGNLICSGTPLTAPVNVIDRDYFQQSITTRKPSAGDLTVGRVSSRPAVIVGQPILNASGEPIGVTGASLDLSSVVKLPAELDLPPGSSVTMLDRVGTVMARNTEAERWIGKPGDELAGLSAPAALGEQATAQGVGLDGVPRLYGIVPLRIGPNDPVQGTLLIGIAAEAAYGPAERAFRLNLLALGVVSLFATSLAWIGTARLVIDPLRAIAAAVQRIAGGDFRARTGLAGEAGEIGVLAGAVDRMAEQLELTQEELDHDRQEMATILGTAASVVSIVRWDGIVTRINQAVEMQFGWPPGEMLGADLNALLDVPVLPIEGGALSPRLLEREGIARDGHTFPVEVELREVEGSRGQRFVAVVRDLTERRRLEAERQRGQVATARAEFLRTLSHELRSPLTAVLGFAQLLSEELTTERSRGHARDINDAGRYMLALVTDLLDLARIDAGRWEVTVEDVDVGEVLSSVVSSLRPRAEERGLSLRVEVAAPPGKVQTDARILREIVTNLTENAIKYTAEGAVVVRAAVVEGTLGIEVIDTGIGIPPDRLESVFEEFEQVRSPSSHEGTGLGLAITRKLVALLGGSIRVASTLGAGSVFTVSLPVGMPDEAGPSAS